MEMAPEDIIRSEQEAQGQLPRTDEGQVALPPTAAEMAEQTVREQLAEALEGEDEQLLEVGRRAIEKLLIEWRDSRISEPMRGNGLVIREKDGTDSHIIRFGPETALRVGMKAMAEAARDRHRAEPEEPCTTACDNPTEAHCVGHCPCYEAGANEGHSSGCNDDSCACWAAGHEAGLEAQRERVGGGTA